MCAAEKLPPVTDGLQLALDLGTTSLVGRLQTATGEAVATVVSDNPQGDMGTDILTRLQRARSGDATTLQEQLVDGLRSLIEQLCAQAGAVTDQVTVAVAAGNPGISCLLCNLPVESLLQPPHKLPSKKLTTITTVDFALGLTVPLQLFPLVSGFVGGDLVAVLNALEDLVPGTLVIDIGTNGELGLWDGRRWWVTSVAAGPAFEGGNISAGTFLRRGAVTDVQLDGDRLCLTVEGGGHPQGLCGSGLAALVAIARDGGIIDDHGRIVSAEEVPSNLAMYLVDQDDGWAIRFHRDAKGELLLTQSDLRQFQLAKGAIRAGAEVLCEHASLAPERVAQVLITGALGTALPVSVLKRVALLPDAMVDKTRFIKDGVLTGLSRYLIMTDGRRRLDALLNQVQPFPLSGTPAFEKHFLAALNF